MPRVLTTILVLLQKSKIRVLFSWRKKIETGRGEMGPVYVETPEKKILTIHMKSDQIQAVKTSGFLKSTYIPLYWRDLVRWNAILIFLLESRKDKRVG